MEAKNWYIIILILSLIVTIFSFINFIQFLNIRNDPDPTVSENSSLALIILNAIVAFAGFILALYCIWQLVKKDNYEPKTFQAYRNQYKKTNADVPENPLDACDEIAKLTNENGVVIQGNLDKFNNPSRYPKLNIDLQRFNTECKEYGYEPVIDKEAPDMKGDFFPKGAKIPSPVVESAPIPAPMPVTTTKPALPAPTPMPVTTTKPALPAPAPMPVTTTKPAITSATNPFASPLAITR